LISEVENAEGRHCWADLDLHSKAAFEHGFRKKCESLGCLLLAVDKIQWIVWYSYPCTNC